MIKQGSTVEVYIGKTDQTWDTMFVTPQDDMDPTQENLLNALYREYPFTKDKSIAFVGVYSIEEPEE